MSFNEYYVRNTNGNDIAGQGTSHATAYKTLQFAVDDIRTTYGKAADDRLNICSESPFVLAAAVSTATYGNGLSMRGHFKWQGYDSVAGDGGVFDIDLDGGAYSLLSGTHDYWAFIDGKVHNNSGNNPLWISDGVGSTVCRMEFYDNSYRAIQGGTVDRCHVHDCSGVGLYRPAVAMGCYLKNGASKKFTRCIELYAGKAYHNILSVDGSSVGIKCAYYYEYMIQNSILSDGGTGVGIDMDTSRYLEHVYGNVVEGFSGAGGRGIELSSGSDGAAFMRHNACFGNETDYYSTQEHLHGSAIMPDNEVLPSSGFAKSDSDTFANRFAYFAPNDVGNMLSGNFGFAKGAVPAASGSAGMLRRSNMRGGY